MHCLKVQHKYSRMGRSNPDVKPPLDRLKAVVKEWPESFKMKDELVRVLEQMLSFQPSDRPTADQLLLLPLLGRFAPQYRSYFCVVFEPPFSHGAHLAQPSPRLQVSSWFIVFH